MKPEVLVKIKKPHKFKDIDLSNKNNLIKPGEMGIGSAVDFEVKKLKEKDVVNLTDIKVFKKAAQKILVAMAEKLLETTPLAPSFVFSQKEHLLDEFFCKELGIAKYKELSYLVGIILTLSHGQAAVEGGFKGTLIQI